MVIIIKGAPFQGSITLTAFGPFQDELAAASWAATTFDGEPEWFIVNLVDPEDIDDLEGELQEVDAQELEAVMAQIGERNNLPKEVMLDLSEIPEEIPIGI